MFKMLEFVTNLANCPIKKIIRKSYQETRRKIKRFRLVFLFILDKIPQNIYNIDKKHEKNHSILNKTFFNGMIEGMNSFYSIYL